jgi:dTDP-glucose pyrophosphorylase
MINCVIPMSGLGSRFTKAGYKDPKPFIPVDNDGTPMIKAVIDNLQCKEEVRFIFICLKSFLNEYWDKFTEVIKGTNNHVIQIDQLTDGSARTVLMARGWIDNDQELIIANCDQLVHDENFMQASIDYYRKHNADGGILSFLTDSPKWSYVRMSGDRIVQTVEKSVISNIGTVGVYYFKHGKYFVDAANRMIDKNDRVNGELYTCPVYNYMISDNLKVIPYMINLMSALGTPFDLEAYLNETRKTQ